MREDGLFRSKHGWIRIASVFLLILNIIIIGLIALSFGAFRIPSPTEATAIVSVGGMLGAAILYGLRQLSKFQIEYLKERDAVLAGTLTHKVEILSTQLKENQETIDFLRQSLQEARNEADRHAQSSQELRRDLQNSNSLYLSLASELAKANQNNISLANDLTQANATIQEQTRMIATENGENVRLQREVYLLSQNITGLTGMISQFDPGVKSISPPANTTPATAVPSKKTGA